MFNTQIDLICNSCGMCCQVMYNVASLEDDEKNLFQRSSLSLPCPYSKGGCLVYSSRPKLCVDYRCCLPYRIEGGEIGILEGLIIVNEAKILISSIELNLMLSGLDHLKLINGMISELLNGGGKKASELILEYDEGRHKDIPAYALSKIDSLFGLLVNYFYNDMDLSEHGMKRDEIRLESSS